MDYPMSELGIWESLIGHGQTIGERSSQQDYYIVRPVIEHHDRDTLLLVLADGMGGHVGGDIASQCGSEAFVDAFEMKFKDESLSNRLKSSLVAADNNIRLEIEENEALRGMGTTLVGAYWDGKGISWGSIGDSPMWIVRRDEQNEYRLDRANDDHSLKPLIERRLRDGVINQEQAEAMPAHQLRSAIVGEGLAIDDQELVNIYADAPVPLYRDEFVIIASDGIETLSDGAIAQFFTRSGHPQDIADALLDAVEDASEPHQDNTSILIFKVPHNLERKLPDIRITPSSRAQTVQISE